MSSESTYRKAETLPELYVAHWTTRGLPEAPGDATVSSRRVWVSFTIALTIGLALGLILAPWVFPVLAGLPLGGGWLVALGLGFAIFRLLLAPVADRLAGVTRLRRVTP